MCYYNALDVWWLDHRHEISTSIRPNVEGILIAQPLDAFRFAHYNLLYVRRRLYTAVFTYTLFAQYSTSNFNKYNEVPSLTTDRHFLALLLLRSVYLLPLDWHQYQTICALFYSTSLTYNLFINSHLMWTSIVCGLQFNRLKTTIMTETFITHVYYSKNNKNPSYSVSRAHIHTHTESQNCNIFEWWLIHLHFKFK